MRMSKAGSVLLALSIMSIMAACSPAPSGTTCSFSSITSLTVYRLPDGSSDVFGTMPAGETHPALARTEAGWVGIDPGVAQAANVGLAHHRWIQLNAAVSPSCLEDVPLVTLADVEADLDASGG